jgi:hypothetical protein
MLLDIIGCVLIITSWILRKEWFKTEKTLYRTKITLSGIAVIIFLGKLIWIFC